MEEYIRMNSQMTDENKLEQGLLWVRKAVQGDRIGESFYDYLIIQAPTTEEKKIISSIREDERRHNRILREIYEISTGIEIPFEEEENFRIPKSYLEGIKKALSRELKAVENYKVIRRILPTETYKDILFEIITDELKHASKYNYLFTLNSIRDNPLNNLSRKDTPSLNNEIKDTSIKYINANDIFIKESESYNTAIFDNKEKFNIEVLVKYITPLVTRAINDAREGVNPEYLFKECILKGVLIGIGKEPEEAIKVVEDWVDMGLSKSLIISKMSRYFDYKD